MTTFRYDGRQYRTNRDASHVEYWSETDRRWIRTFGVASRRAALAIVDKL